MITTILFDLDGTLLPMDQDVFLKGYLGRMTTKLAPHGYDPDLLVKAIWKGTAAMVQNDGAHTNEAVFWKVFTSIFGEESMKDDALFLDYYENEFQQVRHDCGFDSRAADAIREIKSLGFRVALATNPMFPPIATLSRAKWAGLNPDDFDLITTYDNSRHCKPNLEYYKDIMTALNVKPEECIMVGNDVGEDMVARDLGLQVFLLTDCIINKAGEDISAFPHGSFPELMEFVRGLNK